ncbi:alpha/beta hydrolase, partial [Aeromonas salmonicida subsp. salmonicida]
PWLVSTRLPVTWISGSRDHKFHQLACQLVKQGCNINHLTLDGGHNLHASQPERFASCLRDWIASTP